ncbi:hypothetical protein DPMN_071934 [Dreissena polymorpha]|uniref:protein-tyrosine-phosphatase n=1 Tax=Dreissena polymorpha TaxID=45954 RepID=A0A9D4BWL6_DREPO|nr:hypothetical protein DPMN_071934 [Dreissena polymorpha]
MEATFLVYLILPAYIQAQLQTDSNSCGQNCLQCRRTGGKCTLCESGFFISTNGNCKKCSPGCFSCTGWTECTICMERYFRYDTRPGHYCYNCSENCLSCRNLDICHECNKGFYGQRCQNNCLQTCINNQLCDKQTGLCTCPPNFTGTNCDSCKPGLYGKYCHNSCPTNCKICTSNSECLECKPGFHGNVCQQHCSVGCANKYCGQSDAACLTCENGYHGTRCSDKCSDGCKGGACDQYHATCTGGCKEGTFGSFCNQTCTGKCLICTASKDCQKCEDGYFVSVGWPCQQCHHTCELCTSWENCSTCRSGFVGTQCQSRCHENCLTCNTSRSCLTCKPGFRRKDKQCQCLDSLCGNSSECEFCTNSSYYVDERTCCPCNSRCKYASCRSASECKYGCEDGLFGAKCDFNCTMQDGMCSICSGENYKAFKCMNCTSGFYLNTYGKCTICSRSCLEGKCNGLNGQCEMGCKKGYWNKMCETRCKDDCSVCDQTSGTCLTCSLPSLYGGECNISCNTNCINNSCHINGSCTSGCILNNFGQSCDTPCPSNCAHNGSESRCSHETGLCSFGCIDGFTGDNCIETLMKDRYEDTVPAVVIGGVVAAVVIFASVITFGVFINLRRRNREPTTELVHGQSGNEDNASAPVYATVARCGKQDNTGMVYANTPSVEANTATGHDPVYTNDTRNLAIVTTEESLEIDQLDNIARQNAIRFEEDGGVYYNNDREVKKFKIPVDELKKFVISKNVNYFKTEFEKLPYGLLKDYTVSQMKANIAMNRYKGIYPYDDHRVRVPGGNTDYINASFIDGYKRRNEYIATLGPMSKQLGDFSAFWRMVWQQKVEKIVMVTNLVEEETEKCEQYWPNESSSQMFGDVRVLCQSEKHYAEFTRRTFTIEKEEEERTLHHLHFTSWPDKDVPDDVTSIIDFRHKVLHATSVLGGPTIVHCSAGIGRTGTYIAIDILTKEGESERAVDIAGCVLNMRQNRPNMVQTAGQYEFLHHAVAHALTFDCKPVARERFQTYMTTTSKEQIRNIFHQLQETKTSGSLDETTAVERNTTFSNKNRKGSDIPGDVYRPRLYLNQKPGSSDYIHAVFVNSFQTKNKYILAQTPLPNTVADFLALVVQTDCTCIVSFESTSATEKDIGGYLPSENQVLKKGIFNVRCSTPEANPYRVKRKLTIEHQGKELCLTHIEFTEPVLIHCLDGASKCALFSVVASLLQTMEVEHEVNIVNAVSKVRSRRKGAIPNSEQFQFCHDSVLDYIKSSNTYSKVVAEI